MKKQFFTSLLLALTVLVFIGCKKNKEKDYAAVIKDKVWVGTFKYPGNTDQYYSVQFKADGTLTWSEFVGEYPGTWILNGKELRISTIVQAVGSISDDNKLNSIVNEPTTAFVPTLSSGELSAHSGIALENTVWKGSMTGTGAELVLFFQAGSTVKVVLGTQNLYDGSYVRAGAGIRFGTNGIGFGVIMSGGSEIKGRYVGTAITPWQVTKQ